MAGSFSKAHGKLFWFAGGDFADWQNDAPSEIDGGFQTRPGVFSADAIDPASKALAAALPEKLGKQVADLSCAEHVVVEPEAGNVPVKCGPWSSAQQVVAAEVTVDRGFVAIRVGDGGQAVVGCAAPVVHGRDCRGGGQRSVDVKIGHIVGQIDDAGKVDEEGWKLNFEVDLLEFR